VKECRRRDSNPRHADYDRSNRRFEQLKKRKTTTEAQATSKERNEMTRNLKTFGLVVITAVEKLAFLDKYPSVP
jgi:hypothetical protein